MVTNTLAYYKINSIDIKIKYWKYYKEDVTYGCIFYGNECFKNVSNFWYAKITFYLLAFSDQSDSNVAHFSMLHKLNILGC
jgi:hypothetical protein